jgi:hypothetical protein
VRILIRPSRSKRGGYFLFGIRRATENPRLALKAEGEAPKWAQGFAARGLAQGDGNAVRARKDF